MDDFFVLLCALRKTKLHLKILICKRTFLILQLKNIWLMRSTGNEDPHDAVSSSSLVILPPLAQIFPQHSIMKHSQYLFFHRRESQNDTTIKNNPPNYNYLDIFR